MIVFLIPSSNVIVGVHPRIFLAFELSVTSRLRSLGRSRLSFRICLEFVLLGLLDYAVVFFFAEPRFFNDKVCEGGVVDFYLLEVWVC